MLSMLPDVAAVKFDQIIWSGAVVFVDALVVELKSNFNFPSFGLKLSHLNLPTRGSLNSKETLKIKRCKENISALPTYLKTQ